ncbi:MAG: hypothetical protein U0531_21165 [Dehalococcoidia bacterium]
MPTVGTAWAGAGTAFQGARALVLHPGGALGGRLSRPVLIPPTCAPRRGGRRLVRMRAWIEQGFKVTKRRVVGGSAYAHD